MLLFGIVFTHDRLDWLTDEGRNGQSSWIDSSKFNIDGLYFFFFGELNFNMVPDRYQVGLD